MSCYCDYELPVFYHASRPVAKTAHRCSECGTTINPGERYERIWAKWENDPGVIRTCVHCLAIRDILENRDCFCLLHGGLWEEIYNDLTEGDWKPGEKFAVLRLVAEHPRNAACRSKERNSE